MPSDKTLFQDSSFFWERLHPEDKDAVASSVERHSKILRPGRRKSIVLDDGRVKLCHARGLPRRRDDGTITWTSIVEDISEQAKLKGARRDLVEDLQRGQKNIKLVDPASAMGHELFNSVTISMLTCQKMDRLLKEQGLEDSEVYQTFRTLQKRTFKMGNIARSLRTLFNSGSVKFEKLNLRDVVEAVIDELEQRENVELEIDISIEVVGDRDMLEVVFSNLMRNSVDALSDAKEMWIKIEARLEKDFLIIEYSDAGKIALDLGSKLFHHALSQKKQSEGSGVGMLLVAKIIESMHGSIAWLPERNNTTFILKLPH